MNPSWTYVTAKRHMNAIVALGMWTSCPLPWYDKLFFADCWETMCFMPSSDDFQFVVRVTFGIMNLACSVFFVVLLRRQNAKRALWSNGAASKNSVLPGPAMSRDPNQTLAGQPFRCVRRGNGTTVQFDTSCGVLGLRTCTHSAGGHSAK